MENTEYFLSFCDWLRIDVDKGKLKKNTTQLWIKFGIFTKIAPLEKMVMVVLMCVQKKVTGFLTFILDFCFCFTVGK